MTPDSLSILLAPEPDAVASVARRPPPRAVVAPFDLPKVIVDTLDDETATLPRGVPAPIALAKATPKVARGLRARLARLSASLFVAGGAAVLVVALPSPAIARSARAGRVVEVMAHASHVAAGWAGGLGVIARR